MKNNKDWENIKIPLQHVLSQSKQAIFTKTDNLTTCFKLISTEHNENNNLIIISLYSNSDQTNWKLKVKSCATQCGITEATGFTVCSFSHIHFLM